MSQFLQLSDAMLKEGIFDGPQIRKLLKDNFFVTKMTSTEKKVWLDYKNVVEQFLENVKSPEWKKQVLRMVDSFKKLKSLMSLKRNFMDSHVEYFPENIGDYTEEQGERFHQDIEVMKRRYQGRWDENMIADYCWMLKRYLPQNKRKMPLRRSFKSKRVRYNKNK